LQVAAPLELEQIALGHEDDVLLEPLVKFRHASDRTDASAERARADELPERLEVLRNRLALAAEGHELADALVGAPRLRAEPRAAAEVDRLRRDHQLDRDDPLAELDHLREPARGEWRHRHPILDPLRMRRADELERDRLREQTRLGGE